MRPLRLARYSRLIAKLRTDTNKIDGSMLMLDGSNDKLMNRMLALEATVAGQRRLAVGATALVFLIVVALFLRAPYAQATPSRDEAPGREHVGGVMRVRGIVVVDSNGTERVWIGAPLREPRLLGKRSKRGDPVSGILLFDAEGNERGGYVTGDHSRGASLTLDEAGRAAIHLSAGDRGDVHLAFNDISQNAIRIGINPLGPYMSVTSGTHTRFLVPTDSLAVAPGKP